jgi:hypothetical protein
MTGKRWLLEMWATSQVGLYEIDPLHIIKIEFAHDDKELLNAGRKIWGGGVTLSDEHRNELTRSRGKYSWHMFGELAFAFAEDIEPLLKEHSKLKHHFCTRMMNWYEDNRHQQTN